MTDIRTYQDLIEAIEKSATYHNIYVPVYYAKGTMEWFRIDKQEYLRYLKTISDPNQPVPCHIEIDKDGEIYFSPNI